MDVPASFRDPSGFLFVRDAVLYRQINPVYREHFELLDQSGLYERLVNDGLLIPHAEVDNRLAETAESWKVIQPEALAYVSYPYEWCFSQLKAAALTTLNIQKQALDCGMTLKDASAYNIQFRGSQPVLIDTLSFERYHDGRPWIAYRQFCQHFLAPLALMSLRDVRLGRLLQVYIDGIPLDLASSLLPRRTMLRFGLLVHIHLHARSQKRYAEAACPQSELKGKVSRTGMDGLISNLEGVIRRLTWKAGDTEWGAYYDATNYDDAAMTHKMELVDEYLGSLAPKLARIQDLGANTGRFSRIAARYGKLVLSQDVDPAAVEINFQECVAEGRKDILPLLADLTNPSPGIGWAGKERSSFLDRGHVDATLALALVHHLAISNNVPLERLAEFLSRMTRHLIIEFVPKQDSQVKRLLATREDIFPKYTREGFETAFGHYFTAQRADDIRDSERILYLMENKATAQV